MDPTDNKARGRSHYIRHRESYSDPTVTQQCPLRGSLYCEAVKSSATPPSFSLLEYYTQEQEEPSPVSLFLPLLPQFPPVRWPVSSLWASCRIGHTPRRQQTLAKHDKKLHISSSLPTRPPDLLYCPLPLLSFQFVFAPPEYEPRYWRGKG